MALTVRPAFMNDSLTSARLFPLPNLVFFPHVMQPLHIFEPRYREMTTHALESDHLIALVLPMPGWEAAYDAQPPIHGVACLGRILADHRLEDGRFNILLRGQARIRILEEIPGETLYRRARVQVLTEIALSDPAQGRSWRKTLLRKAAHWFPDQSDVVDQLRKLFRGDLPLGTLCDIITFALPLDAEFKQTMLEELNVATRLKRLHDFLDAKFTGVTARPFPPNFSLN